MSFSALDSALTGPLFASDAMRAAFSDRARIAAMLRAEAALAKAEAKEGLAPKALAPAIARIAADDIDLAALGVAAADSGVITIPFVKAVEAKLPEPLRAALHFGATSQDILDTATVLQMRDGLDLLTADLVPTLTALARLATRHRRTPMVGRSYGQHAAPITFGFAAAIWLTGIAEVAAQLPALRRRALVASLGGPVGTLTALGDKAEAVEAAFATELGLSVPAVAWHSLRARIAETGAWLALLVGALAKLATDVVHLSSTEIGEVAEPHAGGRGGSSAMPHKRNPVSSTIILAAHGAAPGHVATLLAAMAAADQRPAGAWHSEWHALPQLFGLASGALREARRLAEGLTVDARRMRANLGLTGGLLFSDAVAAALAKKRGREAAHALATEAADAARRSGRSFRDSLAAAGVDGVTLDLAFDLKPATDAAARMTDRAVRQAGAVKRMLAKRKA